MKPKHIKWHSCHISEVIRESRFGCPHITRVISSEELGTMSKNNLRWITSVRGPIWGIHSLTLIISWKRFIPPEKKQDVNRRIFCFWGSQYSLLSAHVPWCRGPNWFNSLRNRSLKLNGKLVSFYRQIHKFSRRLFATLMVSTFSTQKLSFWRN